MPRSRRRRSSYRSSGGLAFAPYMAVSDRRMLAERKIADMRKLGRAIAPVVVGAKGRSVTSTFWGKAWCANLEHYSDYENRLPRGRSYVRNGAVLDLQIASGSVTALVLGSTVYEIAITIAKVERERWQAIVRACAGQIDSVVELLRGRMPDRVMEEITTPGTGLFPTPAEIQLSCSCPDWATMCKHVAAALYGAGVRLDEAPELLFLLRGVDKEDLVQAGQEGVLAGAGAPVAKEKLLDVADLSSIFGIELEPAPKRKKARKAR